MSTTPSPALLIEELVVHIGQRRILNAVSLKIERGRITALVGESGSGKSTIAKTILDVLPQNATASGKILLHGQNILNAADEALQKERSDKISIIFQDPVNSMDPLQRIGKKFQESLEQVFPESDKTTRHAKSIDLLHQVSLRQVEEKLKSYPHQLSGGECQRIAIADALTKSPEFLVADEPTTALDVATQKEVLDLLSDISRRLNIGILLITHNLEIVRAYSDFVYVMKDGDVVEHGETAAFFKNPKHAYTKTLLGGRSGFSPKKPSEQKQLFEVRDLALDFEVPSILGKTGSKPMLRDITFSLNKGDCLGLVGESGSGKTTLGLALLKLLPARGEVLFNGKSILPESNSAFRKMRRHMQVVFQNPFSSFNPRILVGRSVSEGLAAHEKISSKERDAAVCSIFEEVGLLPEYRLRYPHELSGGELQRAAIARALLLQPDLVILDEPTSSLDHAIQSHIIELLQQMQEKHGLSYLFITHDLSLAAKLCTKLILLKNGRIQKQGPVQEVLAEGNLLG